jgi:hypothetical protein
MSKLLKETLYEEEFKYFKGPSEEKIRKKIEGLSLEEKFRQAVDNNVPWLVKECIDKGIDLLKTSDQDYYYDSYSNKVFITIGESAIWSVCQYGFTEIVKILLEDGRADPRVKNSVTMYWALNNLYTDIIKLLIKDGRADPSIDKNGALDWAADEGHVNIIKQLLKDQRIIDNLTPDQKIRFAKYIK